MQTAEQAKELWCPMARVAQIGAVETSATYNRAILKVHVPVEVAAAAPEDFELGEKPKLKTMTMVQVTPIQSGASMCLANECAMWRWGTTGSEANQYRKIGDEMIPVGVFDPEQPKGYCGLAGRPEVVA